MWGQGQIVCDTIYTEFNCKPPFILCVTERVGDDFCVCVCVFCCGLVSVFHCVIYHHVKKSARHWADKWASRVINLLVLMKLLSFFFFFGGGAVDMRGSGKYEKMICNS